MPTPTSAAPPILRLLGGGFIEADGVPLGGAAAHRHRLALLALLAVNRRPMSRDKVMAYLWPERDTESARTLLRTAVYEIRKLLGEGVIRRTGDALTIDSAVLRCDVLEFEAAVAANDIQTAAALYTGPFLDGFFIKEASEFEHWVDGERLRLERLRERVSSQRETAAVGTPPSQTTAVLVAPETPPSAGPPRARRLTASASFVLVLIVALIAGARHLSKAGEPLTPVLLPDGALGSALELDGRTANVSTDAGKPVTTQVDEIAMDLMAKYEGARDTTHQMLFYNGHGGWSGWGLMVLGPGPGQVDGTIAVIAGGINIMATPLVLRRGAWQHVVAERRAGRFTVWLDDSVFVVGPLQVNPLGGARKDVERTVVGGDGSWDYPRGSFHGAIDRVRIRDLAGAYWIEQWLFDEGKGTLAIGARGTPLRIGSASWAAAPRLTPQSIFWSHLESLCGQAFPGRGTDSAAVFYVSSCEPNAIRLALEVGVDRSRTVLLTKTTDHLELRAERHRQDGREDVGGRFAAVTSSEGSFGVQEFVGRAPGDVARLELEPKKAFSYTLRRSPIQFDLTRQLATPPPPWGVSPQRAKRSTPLGKDDFLQWRQTTPTPRSRSPDPADFLTPTTTLMPLTFAPTWVSSLTTPDQYSYRNFNTEQFITAIFAEAKQNLIRKDQTSGQLLLAANGTGSVGVEVLKGLHQESTAVTNSRDPARGGNFHITVRYTGTTRHVYLVETSVPNQWRISEIT